MKRGAENQLTKESPHDEDDEIEVCSGLLCANLLPHAHKEIQDPQGFQRADESVLAKRQCAHFNTLLQAT